MAAEQPGSDAGWVAQHHFEDGRHGPGVAASPLMFLAAVAGKTRHICLGTAVIAVPLENPLRLAEDAATLDVLSGGRVELDVSSGYDIAAFQAFGVSFDQKRQLTSDGVSLLSRAFRGETLGDTGLQLRPRSQGVGWGVVPTDCLAVQVS